MALSIFVIFILFFLSLVFRFIDDFLWLVRHEYFYDWYLLYCCFHKFDQIFYVVYIFVKLCSWKYFNCTLFLFCYVSESFLYNCVLTISVCNLFCFKNIFVLLFVSFMLFAYFCFSLVYLCLYLLFFFFLSWSFLIAWCVWIPTVQFNFELSHNKIIKVLELRVAFYKGLQQVLSVIVSPVFVVSYLRIKNT